MEAEIRANASVVGLPVKPELPVAPGMEEFGRNILLAPTISNQIHVDEPIIAAETTGQEPISREEEQLKILEGLIRNPRSVVERIDAAEIAIKWGVATFTATYREQGMDESIALTLANGMLINYKQRINSVYEGQRPTTKSEKKMSREAKDLAVATTESVATYFNLLGEGSRDHVTNVSLNSGIQADQIPAAVYSQITPKRAPLKDRGMIT